MRLSSNLLFPLNLASGHLTPVYRSSDKIAVRFVPVIGAAQYNIVARNSEAGPFEGTCDTSSYTCAILGLRPASLYTVWLRTCQRERFLLCDLCAIPLDVFTLPEGKCHNDA